MKANLSNVKILVVSTNEHLTARLLRAISRLSIKADVLALNKSSGSTKISKFCRKYSKYSHDSVVLNWEDIAESINQYCKQENIDVVIPSGMQSTLILSEIQSAITSAKIFPLDHPENIKTIHNKWSLYEDLSPKGLSFPQSVLLENLEQIDRLDMKFPIMAKAIELSDSRGIAKVNSLTELKQYLAHKHSDNRLPLILQDYIDGFDIDLSVLAHQGEVVAWTIQQAFPNHLEFFRNDAVLNLGQEIIKFYKFTGVAHFDLRVDRKTNQAKILECNPRLWASIESSLWYGVDFIYLGTLIALGQTIPAEIQTGVLSTQVTKVPYPWLGKTIKGYINGRLPIKEIPKSSRGIIWKNISDLLPTVYDKALTKLGKGKVYDDMAELLAAKTS